MNFRFYSVIIKKIIILSIIPFIFSAWIDPLKDEVEKGNRSYEEGRFDDALEHYNKSEEYASGDEKRAVLNFNRGAAEHKKGNYEKGIELFMKSLDSKDPEIRKRAYLNMGNSYVELKDYDKAFNSYSRALKIDPSYLKAKKNIEHLLNKQKSNQNSKNDENRESGDKNKDDKEKNDRNNSDRNSRENNTGMNNESSSMQKSDISREQMKNMLESLKKEPLRRQKNGKGEYDEPDKAW